MAECDFEATWNQWHCEICTSADLAAHVFDELIGLDAPEYLKAAAWILRQRLVDQTTNAPIPPWDKIRQ